MNCARGFIPRASSLLLVLIGGVTAMADVPRMIHYQGKLRDAGGAAVSATVSLRFRLYDAPSGLAALLFDETHAGVGVADGLFSALLGSVAGGVPDSALDGTEVYLGVAINGGAELSPRTRIAASPHALLSRSAEQLVQPNTFTPAVTVDAAGNVGIGTTTPTSNLDVNGTFAVGSPETTAPFSATGGTITTSGGYTIHTFTTSGTFTPSGAQNVEVLVVAGGGGGSRGGGGAGGLVYQSAHSVTSGNYAVTIGSGGAGAANTQVRGVSGNNSVFDTITAVGGGGSGCNSSGLYTGSDGGSGGGGGGGPTPQAGGSATQGDSGGGTGYGHAGGTSQELGGTATGGGGGGAGAAGSDAALGSPGTGGNGLTYFGSTYAGGGGGADYGSPRTISGGTGGGGDGKAGDATGNAGTANTGGGGGGGGNAGGAGGSGVVIIRYPTDAVTAISVYSINTTADGNVGIGTTAPAAKLHVIGAGVATLGFSQSSSRHLKEDIHALTGQEAMKALEGLSPMKFRYRADLQHEGHLGFIAEDVPALVANKDRSALNPMDIVTVLTKIVQTQQRQIQQLEQDKSETQSQMTAALKSLQEHICALEEEIRQLSSDHVTR